MHSHAHLDNINAYKAFIDQTLIYWACFCFITEYLLLWYIFTHRISFDEGKEWTQYSFSAVPLFVDGVLVEAGTENQIMT